MHPSILPEFLRPYASLIFGAAYALLIFMAGWLVSKWAHNLLLRITRARGIDEALARFFAALTQYVVLAFAVIAALSEVGIQTTSLVAIFASAGLAVGLALQGSLSNFASGVLLLIFRPLTIGDYVTAAGQSGTVEEIGLFATKLITPANELVVLPNAAVTGGSIVNHSCRGTRRGRVDIGVAYGTDIKAALAALQRATTKAAMILQEPAPSVSFVGFGDSALDFAVFAWSKSSDHLAMLHGLRIAIYDELNAASIDIPFPQVVVHRAE